SNNFQLIHSSQIAFIKYIILSTLREVLGQYYMFKEVTSMSVFVITGVTIGIAMRSFLIVSL
ncbi:hypothetical protein ACLUXF_11585, partial [Lentilactobacillus parabuchneri]|uniref:hypothetical protein n=1 Tax=Lentilactobacillus parabuchneri TaxID=152331 RepID=UPI0039921206